MGILGSCADPPSPAIAQQKAMRMGTYGRGLLQNFSPARALHEENSGRAAACSSRIGA